MICFLLDRLGRAGYFLAPSANAFFYLITECMAHILGGLVALGRAGDKLAGEGCYAAKPDEVRGSAIVRHLLAFSAFLLSGLIARFALLTGLGPGDLIVICRGF